ncbi:BspA family leucine-rich repeat surface protein [Lacinutrix himadriensis]|uniref:BspA family leucine-rich repeat surface protein n=1 Tax=Lacinutrix himadriensis TaxID=641549 RepID=UPI00137927B3|nr:BspA family leucine-rich repeat surface protein [Lacinutrix himadriensis]
MKKHYILFCFLFITAISFAQEPFITTWEVTSNNSQIKIPTRGSNYTIDFGDGTVETYPVGYTITHVYVVAGTYTVTISGGLTSMNFQTISSYDRSRLKSIEQWGDIEWTSMQAAYYGCENLVVNAMDIPDLSQVTNMSKMFYECSSFNQSFDNWDVSNVTNMSYMFQDASSFNLPINSWNVVNVTDMSFMFRNATSFNQPLNSWNVFNVTDMESMFQDATSFNQPINSWDVGSVTNMRFMFRDAESFNQEIDNWDVSNVRDMRNMFYNANSFNQSLYSWNFNSITFFDYFVMYSGLDVTNYDLLLSNLAGFTLQNVTFISAGLRYCNVSARDYLINNLGWSITADTLSNECKSIFGTVVYDQDNNGCSTTDIQVESLFVEVNNGTYISSGLVNNGEYSTSVIGSTFTVSLSNVPDYFTASPQSATVDFTTSSTEQVDFCLSANQTVNDLNIILLPINEARLGFEAAYKLVVENIGTQTINNITASLVFDDIKQSFVSATPIETSSTANSLDFAIASLNPFQKQEIDIIMQTFAPPTLNGDDILNFTASVLPNTNDYTPNDNTFNLEQIVVNAYDPNDKHVLQGDYITIDETDNYLDYIIRFQNTGTANATFVRIEDDLDADLDWSTLKMVSASHDYDVKITNGNEVEFLFDNINLPYEVADELNSHGYIAYKIKPKNTLELGGIMSGNASIYFDYNLPIVTNTVSTEVVNNLSVDDFGIKNLISIYPNPTSLGVFIKTKDGITVSSVTLYNIQGTQLFNVDRNLEFINTKEIASGIYILSIDTNKGKVIKKLIIE